MANELTKIPKFRRCVLQNFPFIEQDFDALTDYQLLCKVVEYLNKVITSQNEVIELSESLSLAFNQLQSFVEDYFENLDVQEEINNKLDQMVEDGTLQEIITTYIQANVTWTFDSVADMKASTNLIAGSYAQTLGYHTLNDGGGATYYITDSGTANEMDIIAVGDLYANLVYGDKINVKQLGVYGDDTHDDADAIKRAIALVKDILIPEGTYLLNSSLTIEGSYDTTSYKIRCNGTLHTTATYGLIILGSYHDVYIQKFTGNNSNTLIALTTDETYTTCGYNQINLRIGSNCNNAIALIPTRQGVLYNNITFSNLFANNTCILFQTDDVNASYVNENHFVGGRCNTGTGIKMVKGTAQTDKYNGNRFETIGFEGIECGIDIEYASRNNFVDCRTSESLTGSYWVKVASDCYNNYFKFETIAISKIQDLNNNQGSYNTYEGSLEIEGNSNASSMRIMMGGFKVFPNKYNFYKYQSYVDMYNQTSGAMTADYYYNDMVFRVGADDASTISLHMSDAFARGGITSFYVFIRKLASESTFEIKNRANSSVVIRQSNFTAPLENKMYHIEYTPGISDTGNDWSVTSVYRVS